MPHKDLAIIPSTRAANRNARVPKNLPLRHWLMLGVVVAVLLTSACDSPGYAKEELQSDTLPEFDDAAIAGQWLSEGELVTFEVVGHGAYLFKGGDEDEVVRLELKRVQDVLIMEYSEERSGTRYFRPCVIGTADNAFEFRCLQSDDLDQLGLRLESVKFDNSEAKIIADTQDRVRQAYAEQANNKKVFAPTLRLTRPQPALVLRARRAAMRGNAEAQERLANYLRDGEIVERDREEALEWALKAATAGRASAQVLCGDMLASNWSPITEGQESFDAAREWYDRAAKQKFAPAFSRLGHLYENPVLGNDEIAVDYYRRGAQLGDSESQAQLGSRYYQGKGVPQDEKLAKLYLEQIAEASRNETAWRTLALLYLYSEDAEIKNAKKALHAAEKTLEPFGNTGDYAVAAQAAYEAGVYCLAARYQKEAVAEGGGNQQEEQIRFELYRNLAQVTSPGCECQ